MRDQKLQRRMKQACPLAGLLLCFTIDAAENDATTVYRSVSPDGVVTFSDAPQPAAVPVEVIPPPRASAIEQRRAEQRFEQQLALLEFLETSRQAREADELAQRRLELDYVRSEAALERARALQAQREANDAPTYVYPYWYAPQPWPPAGGRPHPPPHGQRPPPAAPKQRVQFPKRSG